MCKDKKDVLNEIAEKLDTTIRIVEKLGYEPEKVSAKEFHDWMNREIFSEDTTTLNDVLSNEYYMVHELVEISELKKAGFKIHKRVIVESPREVIYRAHFYAQEFEMDYAIRKRDYSWMKDRLDQHRKISYEDPNLPNGFKSEALRICEKFCL